jgi:O-acetyl-ADP-ribose deacetylase (regulator of RNase III)
MIHYVKGDLLETDCDNICHQVNCQGKMNSGVAKAIREKWPRVYENYRIKYEEGVWCKRSPLGDIQIVPLYDNYYETDKHQCVVNFFSQENYGYDGKRYTSYDAFWNCLNLLKQTTPLEQTIAFPWRIGCVRGGANWTVIRTMIEEVFKDRDIYFYSLGEFD